MDWRSFGHSKLPGKSKSANWLEFQCTRAEFFQLTAYAFYQIEMF